MIDLALRSGLDIRLDPDRLGLSFGSGMGHLPGVHRTLDDVRSMLQDPSAQGPADLYTIYMDICRSEDLAALKAQGLLYGAVVYNHGVVGKERLRSQGHIHSEAPGTGMRYSEVYEFWSGRAYLYLQKECAADVSRVILVEVRPGDRVVVPSGWVHLVVTLGDEIVSFGAWCARENRIEYEGLRALGGPAYFVLADESVAVNPRYHSVSAIEYRSPSEIPGFDLPADRPIYRAWQEDPRLFDFLPDPRLGRRRWAGLDVADLTAAPHRDV
jgi:glucose-6-phosphate isomerase, archaeal